MAKRRRLEELYVVGREVSVNDGRGEPVVVWLQKLSPLDYEKAMRKAGAAKAKVLIGRHNHDSEDWQEAFSDITDLGPRPALVEYLITEELAQVEESAEAELSFEEEWAKDGYLQGLRDAWEDPERPLKDVYAADPEGAEPDGVEAKRVFDELKRFSDKVQAQVDGEAVRLRQDMESLSIDDLNEKAVQRFIELRAGMAWLREYRRCEVWLATREVGNHDVFYFPDRESVDRLAIEVFKVLAEAYQELMVEPAEGKDSVRTPSSLPPSASPSEGETSESSGLQVVKL